MGAGDSTLIYSGTVGSKLTSPVSFSSGGNTLTFSATGGEFELDQAGNNYVNTAFANGTTILYAAGFSGATAPITISFTNPVSEFGFTAEDYASGNFTVSFTVFNGVQSLGTFTANGNDPSALSFEGARASAGDVITSVLITDNSSRNIGLGPITFAAATDVPEPASLALLGMGAVGIVAARRRRGTA